MPGVWGLAPTKRAEEVTRVGPTARPGQEVEEAIAEACRGGYDVRGTSPSFVVPQLLGGTLKPWLKGVVPILAPLSSA